VKPLLLTGALVMLFAAAGCSPQVVQQHSTAGTLPVVATQTPPAQGGTEVLAEGVSAFSGGWDTARDHALNDALRKAVEQGVGAFIDSQTRVENFQLLSDRIYSHSAGYVSSYTIIHEEQAGDLYRVVVRAVVDSGGIEGDLAAIGLLLATQGRPRVMVVVREIGESETMASVAASSIGSMFETLLLEQFRSRGFPVVDAATVSRIMEQEQLRLILEGDEHTAALVGMEAGAEIVVYGTVNKSRFPRIIAGSSREIHSMAVNTRAVNSRTASVLAASATTTELPFSEEQARLQASEKTADQLVSSILEGWTQGDNSTVIVAYNADFELVQNLRSQLRTGVRGVSDVVTRSFTGSMATIEVFSSVPSAQIIDGLGELDGSFRITGVSGNRVEISFSD
jgi:hypothetical protein